MFAFVNKQRASVELERRRGDEATYTSPLNLDDNVKDFLTEFYRKILFKQGEEMKQILEEHPQTVGKFYDRLVTTDKVSNEDFWQRYYYRCDSLERIQTQLEDADAIKKKQKRDTRKKQRESISKTLNSSIQNIVTSVSGALDKMEQELVLTSKEGQDLSKTLNSSFQNIVASVSASSQEKQKEEEMILSSKEEEEEEPIGVYFDDKSVTPSKSSAVIGDPVQFDFDKPFAGL